MIETKRWEITKEFKKPFGKTASGHSSYPGEWVPILKLISRLEKEVSPCIDCDNRSVCKDGLACAEFYVGVNMSDSRTKRGELFKMAKKRMSREPSRDWYEAAFPHEA